MSSSTSTKVGHILAKGLGIKVNYRNETGNSAVDDKLTRGESVFSIGSGDSYTENIPTSADFIRENIPNGHDILTYIGSLFPFIHWIPFYNVQWLIGDLVAGITIGAIVVPQGMAYATLASLSPEFGLYTSFMGVLIYWFFATSKDITIGPVAVMSTIVGNIVISAQAVRPDIPGYVIASALAIICGGIVTFLGLIRWGWLTRLISLSVVTAFITGSSINIAVGQVPTLMGITTVNSRDSTYLVIINTLKHLGDTKLDAALGLTSLTMLYLIRAVFNILTKKVPKHRKVWFFCNTLRSVFVILLYTLIGWLANLNLKNHDSKLSPFKILGNVPRGFTHAGAPKIDTTIINLFSSQIPASVIVLLIEHISIAKSFGRINNYTINPSQELVAIGVTNLLGPFLGAYPATGSFSRTAIKSKAGVRTPFAGVITALVVLLAIYALPAVFFYIPSAALSGVIIHAVGDLITPPNTVYQFWRISPLEVIIFFAGVFVTIFSSIENGIYTTIATSFFIEFWRMFMSRGRFLGKVQVHSVVGDHVLGEHGDGNGPRPNNNPDKSIRNIFVPLDHNDGSNPSINVEHPYPGIFIYRFSEGYAYPNASWAMDQLVSSVLSQCRRTSPGAFPRLGDRPWNDPGTSRKNLTNDNDTRPTLKAIILDFSSVDNLDLTATQTLIDVRNQLDRYTTPRSVQWHFANVNNRWAKRSLVAAGFGYPTPDAQDGFHRWKPVFSVAELGGEYSAAAAAEEDQNREELRRQSVRDIESAATHHELDSGSSRHSLDKEITRSKAYNKTGSSNIKITPVHGLNRPLFHIDLTSALQSAISFSEKYGYDEDSEHADSVEALKSNYH